MTNNRKFNGIKSVMFVKRRIIICWLSTEEHIVSDIKY